MASQLLSRERLRRTAARWHDPGGSGTTYLVAPGHMAPAALPLPEAVRTAIVESPTGAILLWSLAGAHLVLPPFPVGRDAILPGWHTGPIQSLLDRPRRIGVFLLRLGGYAVGVFEGERLVASKVGSRFVKGRHKKGGSSSARFARRRGEQANALFKQACQDLQDHLGPARESLEHVVLGGDRRTLLAFEKRCPYLSQLAKLRLGRVLDVPEPRLKVLEGAGRLLYNSQVITFAPELDRSVQRSLAPKPPLP